jgi:hypothetical protein
MFSSSILFSHLSSKGSLFSFSCHPSYSPHDNYRPIITKQKADPKRILDQIQAVSTRLATISVIHQGCMVRSWKIIGQTKFTHNLHIIIIIPHRRNISRNGESVLIIYASELLICYCLEVLLLINWPNKVYERRHPVWETTFADNRQLHLARSKYVSFRPTLIDRLTWK